MTYLALAIWALCFWGMVCATRARQQRGVMINSWFDNLDRWRDMHAAYHKVSFERHMWALIRFRDPHKLYPPEAFPDA